MVRCPQPFEELMYIIINNLGLKVLMPYAMFHNHILRIEKQSLPTVNEALFF